MVVCRDYIYKFKQKLVECQVGYYVDENYWFLCKQVEIKIDI